MVNVLGRGGKKRLLNLALMVRNQTESYCPVRGGGVLGTGKMWSDREKAALLKLLLKCSLFLLFCWLKKCIFFVLLNSSFEEALMEIIIC